VEINCKDDTCTIDFHKNKKHKEKSQDDKNESKEVNKWAAARGESDLALQGSPSERNLSDVQTYCHVEVTKTHSSGQEE
jgi:hypothetical protein